MKLVSNKFAYAAIIFVFSLFFSVQSYGLDIEIDVAPNILNLGSSSQVVTVHTDISFWVVDHDEVLLNGILIQSSKADNRGFFVAKFNMDEVKALAESGELTVGANELTLTGTTIGGEDFIGSQTITVIDVVPSGK